MDYHVWDTMLERSEIYANVARLKSELCFVDDKSDLPQDFIDKAMISFSSGLQSCIAAAGGHFEHFKYSPK